MSNHLSKIFIFGCKSEARAIAHSLKTFGCEDVEWYRPWTYSDIQQDIDDKYSSYLNIKIAFDDGFVEEKIAGSHCFVFTSNFRIIDVSNFGDNVIAINFHNSRLPSHKGIHPLHWQIRDGLKNIFVSAHKISEEVDSGGLILRSRIKRKRTMLFHCSTLSIVKLIG